MPGKLKDLTNLEFGKLTVIELSHIKSRKSYWKCLCSCGNETTVRSDCLRDGNTKSCGCLNFEPKGIIHNMHNTKLYHVWASMKDRCSNLKNKKYEYYGGKGVKVCESWLEFLPFYNWAIENGYKEKLTIDRIDVAGNYEPNNCRWITQQEQSENTTSNRNIEYNGKTLNITQWAKELNIKRATLNARLNNGWSIERAFTTFV
jgi:hypothetical protein